MNPLATRPHHIGIVVSNLDRSRAWYEELLGFHVTHATEIPERGLKIAYLERQGFSLELFEQAGSAPSEWASTGLMDSFMRQGHHHFAFSVDDVDAIHEELVRRGIPIDTPPTSAEALGVRFMFARDPDGIWVEFLTPLG